jgi:hypothetical protein
MKKRKTTLAANRLRAAGFGLLFGIGIATAYAEAPLSRESLFDDDDVSPPKSQQRQDAVKAATTAPEDKKAEGSFSGLKGFVQFELARTIAGPAHWSKMLTRLELGGQGNLGNGIKYKISARADYDAVYDLHGGFYPSDVRRDQRFNLTLRENYIDFGSGNWDFRLGRQHVVWGEMVGLFFADVVSALESREFILPEFDIMRIPQWAVRAEYFKDDYHAELLWVPVASYDEIGKPGAEFFPAAPPAPPGYATRYRHESRPTRNLSNANYGLRAGTLKNGWDISAFYYASMANTPTFYRQIIAAPQTFVYQARHDRIHQIGGTVAKDLGAMVFKGEGVYTHGRRFNVSRLTDDNGVVRQSTLDWALGLDFPLPSDTRLNLQVFQRVFFDYDQDIYSDKRESGYSVLLNRKFSSKWEAEALLISSFNRSDWLFRPKMLWTFEKNWKLAVGLDIFKGPPLGMFGRYDNRDRIYSEIRHSF